MRPPESWRNARLTLIIAGVTGAAWLIISSLALDPHAAVWAGVIPARFSGLIEGAGLAPVWLTPLSATLVHAGFVHLAFNLLILLFCGRAVEAIVGMRGFAILYLAGAYAAAGAQYLTGPTAIIPMVGASGAISAVLGAYAILFGRNRVNVADPTLALWLNALWLLVAWVILQIVVGITFASGGIQIAIAAHIGGFLFGLLAARPLLLLHYRRA